MAARPFNLDEPLGYFITWTTYGTWLSGDDRGWNRRGEPGPLPPSPLLVEINRTRMKETEFRLSPEARRIVEATVRKHCEIRGWFLHAVNPRSNHVHLVVTAAGYEPKKVRDQLKAWCTRRLKEAGVHRTRVWTEGGSCRWLNTDDELETAVVYVTDGQD